jgi:hypothetical protein
MVGLWNQLYLTAGLRNDGTSVFSPGKKRYWYPKVSTAWDFSSFRRNQSWLNFGKLRVAYGQTGRTPGAYSTITGFSTQAFDPRQGEQLTTTAYGHVGVVTDRTRGQEDIKPERAKEYEMGLDVGLINRRVGLEITYYNQKTTDVIYALPVAPSTGFGNEFQNAGTINNSEVEDDPNRATTASADLLFNAVQVAGFAIQEGLLSQTSAIWTQQLAGTDRQHLALGQYVITEADYAYYMSSIYWGGWPH